MKGEINIIVRTQMIHYYGENHVSCFRMRTKNNFGQ